MALCLEFCALGATLLTTRLATWRPAATRFGPPARALAALAPAGDVTSRKMFGEHGVYLGDRFVGIIADEQLFLKITPGSRGFLGEGDDAPPYPGAKAYHCVPEARWRHAEWLARFVRAVAADVPPPKPKKTKGG